MNGEDRTSADEIRKAAKEIKKSVDALAVPMQQRSILERRSAARRWAVSKLAVEQSFAHIGVLLYAVLALVGMVYSAMLYYRFDIAILDFYETPDFLLGAAAGLMVLTVSVGAVLVVVILLLATYSKHVQGFAQGRADRPDRSRRGRIWTGALAFAAAVSPIALAAAAGTATAKSMASDKEQKRTPVRVTLRDDVASARELPNAKRTILLGVTNRFHFFYECANGQESNTIDCDKGKGKAFVFPTDNIAAVAYDEGTETKKDEQPTVAQAIGDLAKAIADVGQNTTIRIGEVEATLNTKGIEEAIDRLATRTDPLTVVPDIKPAKLVLTPSIESTGLTINADVRPPELTLKTRVEPADLKVRVEVPPNPPPEPHIVVIRNGTKSVAPVYAVPFRALSPISSKAEGIVISPRTEEWLGELYRSLAACGDVRVTVTGHASRRGFGDPQHQSFWRDAIDDDEDTKRMNCGLANLRALKVASTLFASTGGQGDGESLAAAVEAEKHLGETCPDPSRHCRLRAEQVRDDLFGLCPPPEPWEWSGTDNGVTVRVRPWRGPDDSWSWLKPNQSHLLDRSVLISLDTQDGAALTCPELLEVP